MSDMRKSLISILLAYSLVLPIGSTGVKVG